MGPSASRFSAQCGRGHRPRRPRSGEDPRAEHAATYFDHLDVFADGSDFIVSLGIGSEQIAQLLAMAKSGGSIVVEAK